MFIQGWGIIPRPSLWDHLQLWLQVP